MMDSLDLWDRIEPNRMISLRLISCSQVLPGSCYDCDVQTQQQVGSAKVVVFDSIPFCIFGFKDHMGEHGQSRLSKTTDPNLFLMGERCCSQLQHEALVVHSCRLHILYLVIHHCTHLLCDDVSFYLFILSPLFSFIHSIIFYVFLTSM